MTEQLKAEQLAAMSVEELLNLDTTQIAPMSGFKNLPKGSYSGVLQAFTTPTGENAFFESDIRVTAVIELEDMNELASAQELIEKGVNLKNRYYMTSGLGVAAMNTEFSAVIIASGGKLGNLMYRVTQEQIPVNFVVTHRHSKPGKNASAEEKAKFESKTFVEVKQVTPA